MEEVWNARSSTWQEMPGSYVVKTNQNSVTYLFDTNATIHHAIMNAAYSQIPACTEMRRYCYFKVEWFLHGMHISNQNVYE